MIRTHINLNDPKSGKPVHASPELIEAVRDASRMLEEIVRKSDPFQKLEIRADWQFENQTDVTGEPLVRLRLSYEGEAWNVVLSFPSEFQDRDQLQKWLGRNVSDFASYMSKQNLRKLERLREEWTTTAVVED